MTFLSRRQAALAMLPLLWAASHAMAQTAAYPTRPISLIVPFAAGGGTDLVARVLAQHMEKTLGQPVLVENKPGANANLAGAYVAKARPDGYTVLYNTSSMTINPAMYRNPGYDALKDLAPVGLSASIPTGLIVAPAVPAKTMAEFIAYAKAHPGQLSYGSSGVGNINHMSAVQLALAQGIDAVHVPYKGSSAAIVDLSANRIQFMIDTVSNITGFVRDGRFRLVAVATPKRVPIYPDVPTFAESGIRGAEGGAWSGMVVPAQTPQPVIARLNAALLAALQAPEVRQKLAEQGTEALGSSPEEYGVFLRKEMARWAQVAKQAGVVPE
jgi:tripartite-type tricarboxylate transporter receptor subunit TctC